METAPNAQRIDSVTGGRPFQLNLLVGDDQTVLVDSGGSCEPENFIFHYLKNLRLTAGDLDVVTLPHNIPVKHEPSGTLA